MDDQMTRDDVAETEPPERLSALAQAPSDSLDAEHEGPSFVEMDPTGRYGRFDEVLGRGACKIVYKAFDTQEGTEVAWNQVGGVHLSYGDRDAAERDRLFAEIRVLKALKHKNIMSFYDSWYDPQRGNVDFITELFTSGTLRRYRSRHRHADPEVLKGWAWQILCGLVYLHGHNPPIIHRDLKCDNIFINGSDGTVKIGDLGLATLLRARTAPQSVLGTPEFMAPELYEEEYDDRVDVYSFGMCLLELCTMEYPYSECTNAAQIYRKVSLGVRPAALRRIVDPEAAQLINVCIAPLEHRPRARLLLKHPWFDSVRVRQDAAALRGSASSFALAGAGAALAGAGAALASAGVALASAGVAPAAPFLHPFAPDAGLPCAPPGVALAGAAAAYHLGMQAAGYGPVAAHGAGLPGPYSVTFHPSPLGGPALAAPPPLAGLGASPPPLLPSAAAPLALPAPGGAPLAQQAGGDPAREPERPSSRDEGRALSPPLAADRAQPQQAAAAAAGGSGDGSPPAGARAAAPGSPQPQPSACPPALQHAAEYLSVTSPLSADTVLARPFSDHSLSEAGSLRSARGSDASELARGEPGVHAAEAWAKTAGSGAGRGAGAAAGAGGAGQPAPTPEAREAGARAAARTTSRTPSAAASQPASPDGRSADGRAWSRSPPETGGLGAAEDPAAAARRGTVSPAPEAASAFASPGAFLGVGPAGIAPSSRQASNGRRFAVVGTYAEDRERLGLRLRIRESDGATRTVEFEFDLLTDTAAAIAREMVEDLELSGYDADAIAAAIRDEVAALSSRLERAVSATLEAASKVLRDGIVHEAHHSGDWAHARRPSADGVGPSPRAAAAAAPPAPAHRASAAAAGATERFPEPDAAGPPPAVAAVPSASAALPPANTVSQSAISSPRSGAAASGAGSDGELERALVPAPSPFSAADAGVLAEAAGLAHDAADVSVPPSSASGHLATVLPPGSVASSRPVSPAPRRGGALEPEGSGGSRLSLDGGDLYELPAAPPTGRRQHPARPPRPSLDAELSRLSRASVESFGRGASSDHEGPAPAAAAPAGPAGPPTAHPSAHPSHLGPAPRPASRGPALAAAAQDREREGGVLSPPPQAGSSRLLRSFSGADAELLRLARLAATTPPSAEPPSSVASPDAAAAGAAVSQLQLPQRAGSREYGGSRSPPVRGGRPPLSSLFDNLDAEPSDEWAARPLPPVGGAPLARSASPAPASQAASPAPGAAPLRAPSPALVARIPAPGGARPAGSATPRPNLAAALAAAVDPSLDLAIAGVGATAQPPPRPHSAVPVLVRSPPSPPPSWLPLGAELAAPASRELSPGRAAAHEGDGGPARLAPLAAASATIPAALPPATHPRARAAPLSPSRAAAAAAAVAQAATGGALAPLSVGGGGGGSSDPASGAATPGPPGADYGAAAPRFKPTALPSRDKEALRRHAADAMRAVEQRSLNLLECGDLLGARGRPGAARPMGGCMAAARGSSANLSAVPSSGSLYSGPAASLASGPAAAAAPMPIGAAFGSQGRGFAGSSDHSLPLSGLGSPQDPLVLSGSVDAGLGAFAAASRHQRQ